jgi:hypothetical protein
MEVEDGIIIQDGMDDDKSMWMIWMENKTWL